MLKTTLNEIKAHSPCADFWEKLLKFLGKTKADDEPLGLDVILESNGVRDCVWSLRTQSNAKLITLKFAIFCAQRVLPIYEKSYPNDKRPREAIEAARQYLIDPSEDNAWTASRAADAAAYAAAAAADAAAYAAAYAAWAASRAADAAAYAAAYAAVDVAYAFATDAAVRAAAAAADAAYAFSTASRAAYAATYAAAARAAYAAADVAYAAADAAYAAADTEERAQKQELLRLLKETASA